MGGVRKLEKIQLGAEGTKGTAVAATAIWRGTGQLEDLLEVVSPPENVGYLPPLDRTYIPKVGGQLDMDEVEATFEQLPYILMAGVKSVSGVQDGAGSDYVWTFPFPTTSVNTIKTYTLEGGNNQQAEEMAYCFVPEFSIRGAADEAVKMQARWIGRQLSTTTFTGGLSLPSVEEILFNLGKLYIDDAGGSFGGTQKSNTLISMALNVTTGNVPYQAADGNLYFSGDKQVGPDIALELTFEHNSTAVAEIANWRAETARLVRLIFEGSSVATAGTDYSKKTLIIDVAGKWSKFSKLDERDGNDIVTGTLDVAYNSTASHYAEIVVVNELSSLP